jgi:hypothetical protein
MERSPARPLPPLDQATPDQLQEALAHWDELEGEDLVRLASHRATARRLAALRRVEGALEAGVLREEAAAPSDCPSAEALYDLGRGPGFAPMPAEERAQLEAHLEGCADCRGLVATLRTPPPLPLDLGHGGPGAPLTGPGSEAARFPARPLRDTRGWLPLAAAAAVVGALMLPRLFGPTEATFAGLPEHPLLRGAETAGLLFPRGRVLGEGLAAAPLYELAPVEGASGYRVEVLRHDGGVFSEGEPVQVLRSATPELAGAALETGFYTWRATAEVDGLERELGAREFEVVRDEARAALLSGDAPLVDRIRALHEAGYPSDARRLARELPEGPQKDAYLSAPGR